MIRGADHRRTGAVAEFEAFYDRVKEPIYRALALSTGDVELAREAVDEALTRAYERWSKVSGYDCPEAWVFRVALNWSRSVFRKRRREDLWSDVPDHRVGIDRLPDHELRTAISMLGDDQRQVVVCRYLLDWSTADTALALGIPEATVKTRLRRSLARLAEHLGEASP